MSDQFAQHTELGFTLLGESRFDSAIAAFRRAMIVDPGHAVAAYGVGFTELRRSNWQVATQLLSWAVFATNPRTTARVIAEVHIALGHCLKSNSRPIASSRSFRRASIVEPANAQIYFNHSNCAEIPSPSLVAKWATLIAPGSADHWNNLGRFLADDAAIKTGTSAYRRALILEPGHPHAWNNLGILEKRRDQTRAAIRYFRRARQVDPRNEQALANLGRNLLLTGELADGWAYLEEPWRTQGLQPRDGSISLPVWNGAPLNGGQLLLWSEEKIGEEIMFSTMLKDVSRRTGPVTLLCNPRIAALLDRAMPEIKVLGWANGTPPPVDPRDYAACYPLEFVGRFVRRRLSDYPPARPLLKATLTTGSARRRPVRSRPLVGLNWRSINPLVGDYKSIPLSHWKPVLSVPEIDFVSLQYGPVAEELDEVRRLHGNSPIEPEGIDQLVDMDAFTDLVASLDLVISVSGTSAHVAGSLGRPTWVLLPRGPGLSWFWFEAADTSPWYPRCELYRQTTVENWEDVMEKVGRNLRAWRERFAK
jgi:tetratricopeptide (TPR) repeat protein